MRKPVPVAFFMATNFAWQKWHVHESNWQKQLVLTLINASHDSLISNDSQ